MRTKKINGHWYGSIPIMRGKAHSPLEFNDDLPDLEEEELFESHHIFRYEHEEKKSEFSLHFLDEDLVTESIESGALTWHVKAVILTSSTKTVVDDLSDDKNPSLFTAP